MTAINWEASYYTFGRSDINYEVAQKCRLIKKGKAI